MIVQRFQRWKESCRVSYHYQRQHRVVTVKWAWWNLTRVQFYHFTMESEVLEAERHQTHMNTIQLGCLCVVNYLTTQGNPTWRSTISKTLGALVRTCAVRESTCQTKAPFSRSTSSPLWKNTFASTIHRILMYRLRECVTNVFHFGQNWTPFCKKKWINLQVRGKIAGFPQSRRS